MHTHIGNIICMFRKVFCSKLQNEKKKAYKSDIRTAVVREHYLSSLHS